MDSSQTIPELDVESFFERLKQCLSQSSQLSRQFEQTIGDEAEVRLASMGQSGWDYEVACPFFDGQGASILIQNTVMDWPAVFQWLLNRCEDMPTGSLVNFEVYDAIRGTQRVGGDLIQRCVISTSGCFMHR